MKKLLLISTLVAMSAFAFDSVPDDCLDCDGQAAVPEPATVGLMGAGVAAIGFAAWRKNRKR